MKKLSICNLFAGLGGNRRLWENCEVTAVELNPDIAAVYQDLYPNDTVIVADAHQYLLDHYKEFDFIWASPPCPTHSDIRRCGVHAGQYAALYPDMTLYQEIILLKHFHKKGSKWVIENVKPYYEPLIQGKLLHRHLFWSNFYIGDIELKDTRRHNDITGASTVYGYNLEKYDVKDKRKLLRNMVNPELGLHVLESSKQEQQTNLFN